MITQTFGGWVWVLPDQEQEEWRPLALMVAEFEAATPARHVSGRAGPRAVQYMPPPLPADGHARPQVRG